MDSMEAAAAVAVPNPMAVPAAAPEAPPPPLPAAPPLPVAATTASLLPRKQRAAKAPAATARRLGGLGRGRAGALARKEETVGV